ncbi:Ldh family oxidoreductase (plasmid) [Agrobacterium leguminum]|uniref:(R)-2-hydroxyacid dehydrogenase n=1 Tax=Agrobacterium deltaense NCPPB 1641 TaxID=1183425 RepID=A0A1S7U9B0_9HYPH|nr:MULTISPECIES: Ldh family oxidoreductase [Agrobacterium]WFS70078.1 Ldh family oxidoreductase [Agrobacterium leguminum]CVI63447.1 (R)-2-hydroxyacid dehydrogenase [Agrobacterium deltaense NCPPB 1641]
MPTIDSRRLSALAQSALQLAGAPEEHAALQADLLLEAELRGVPSHGLLRLSRIIARIRNGVADPHASGEHVWASDAFLSVDGQRGLGPVVAIATIEALVDRAKQTGIAAAAITNSNHIGMLAWYAEQVASRDFSIIVLSTSEALVHPWGARTAMIGTNPIAIGVPTEDGPFVMDTATSVVSMGEIHDHAHRKAAIPELWALDQNGNPTTDAEAAKNGAIAPFGQAKGYALGLAFELLVSGLAASAIGRDVHGTLDDTSVCNKGDLIIVMPGPRRELASYLQAIRDMEPADGFEAVLIPGERGRACRDQRMKDGVPVVDDVYECLLRLAGQSAAA